KSCKKASQGARNAMVSHAFFNRQTDSFTLCLCFKKMLKLLDLAGFQKEDLFCERAFCCLRHRQIPSSAALCLHRAVPGVNPGLFSCPKRSREILTLPVEQGLWMGNNKQGGGPVEDAAQCP